jgi:uncharacterized protein (TIGR02246 family)
MKPAPFLLLLVVATTFFLSCKCKEHDPEEMLTAAKALDQQFIEAYNKGDVDAIMTLYWNSPDLISYPPGALELRGWQAVKEAMAQTFVQAPGGILKITEGNHQVAGDVVLSWGKWTFTMPMPGGSSMEMTGRFSDVKTERDGKWVYIMDHASAPLPPPPAHTVEQ